MTVNAINGRTALGRPAVLLAIFAVGAFCPSAALADAGRIAWVIDGDTFRLQSGERIRIAGIDAPETRADQAKCRAEIEQGREATRRAAALLKGRQVAIVRVGRSYERTVARVTLDGRDLAEELVARGVARPWPAHRAKPDWCA